MLAGNQNMCMKIVIEMQVSSDKTGRCSVDGRVPSMWDNIFFSSIIGKMCRESVPVVAASMLSMVCVETVLM